MVKIWRKSFNLLLLVFVILNSMSCTKKSTSINALISYDITDNILDPTDTTITYKYQLLDNLNIKLIDLNKQNDYELLLAESIDTSADKKTYRIKIRDAVFSNGDSIQARDVINSLKRLILSGSSHVPLKNHVQDAERLTRIEDNISGLVEISTSTLEIKLKKPVKDFLYYLTLADTGILHKTLHLKDKISLSDYIIVSGAYTLINKTLIANTRFLFFDKGMPQEIRLKNVPATFSKELISENEIGLTSFFDKNLNDCFELPKPYKLSSNNHNFVVFLLINTSKKPLDSADYRRSLAKKIQDQIITPPKNPYFLKAHQYFIPGSKGFTSITKHYETENKTKFDTKINIESTPGTMKYIYKGLSEQLSSSEVVNKINFTETIDQMLKKIREGNFDTYLIPASMNYNIISESLNLLYSEKNGIAKNPNEKIKSLLEKYQSEDIPDFGAEITQLMNDESEVIPLFYTASPFFYNEDRINLNMVNLNESLAFWRMRVK